MSNPEHSCDNCPLQQMIEDNIDHYTRQKALAAERCVILDGDIDRVFVNTKIKKIEQEILRIQQELEIQGLREGAAFIEATDELNHLYREMVYLSNKDRLFCVEDLEEQLAYDYEELAEAEQAVMAGIVSLFKIETDYIASANQQIDRQRDIGKQLLATCIKGTGTISVMPGKTPPVFCQSEGDTEGKFAAEVLRNRLDSPYGNLDDNPAA